MSHPLDPKVATSDPNLSPSSSSTKADTPTANTSTSSHSGNPAASATASPPSDSTVVEGADPKAAYTPPPIVHNILCPKKDEGRTEPCPHCTTFRWVDPGQGNIARGPPEYVPVYLPPSNVAVDEMPKLIHPSPERDLGPPQSLKANPQDSLTKVSSVVRKIDEVKTQKSKEEIDTLLVVAGLFSAIQTAFIIESYQQLQSDSSEVTNQLLFYLSQQLANSSIPAVSEFPSFTTSTSARRINVFWFSGLVISLITASLGIFTKQWLREYLVNESSPEIHLRTRFFRSKGLAKWHVYEIIAALPLLLQFSMLLFFIGLIEFLGPLDWHVDKAVTILVGLWAGLVIFATLGPILSPQCPWKTPLLHYPVRWIRDFFFARYCDFDEWRFRRYKLTVHWHPQEWFTSAQKWTQDSIRFGLYIFLATILYFVEFFCPPERFPFRPIKKEEEDVRKSDQDDFQHLIDSYELVQTDEHLRTHLEALDADNFNLNEVVQFLKGIHKIRQSDDNAQGIGLPISYGSSLVPTLIPLLVNKIQKLVKWSNVDKGYGAKDLVLALRFLLDPYNEKFIDEHVLWPLVGGLLKDHHFSRRTIEAFVKSWDVIHAVPKLPQMNRSGSQAIVENVLVDVRGLLNKYVTSHTVSQTTSATSSVRRNEGSGNQEGKEKAPAGRPDKPGILLDVMLSILSHANLSDIEEYFDLFSQTISDFAVAVRLMNSVQEDVAISLDFSIRRLNHLCQRLPSLTSICVVLVKELEFHLVQHYIQNAKIEKKYRDLQRILGISPHWRQVLERNGLLVAVDGIRVPGSGL